MMKINSGIWFLACVCVGQRNQLAGQVPTCFVGFLLNFQISDMIFVNQTTEMTCDTYTINFERWLCSLFKKDGGI